jgi:hypothetical protein
METTTRSLPSVPQMVQRASRYAAEMLANIAAGTSPYELGYDAANHPDEYELREVARKLRDWGCVAYVSGSPEVTERGRELLAQLTP